MARGCVNLTVSCILGCMDIELRKKICPEGLQPLASHLGISYQAVQRWFVRGKIPAERVLAVEAATGISRHELRGDIYPVETNQQVA